MVGELSRDAKGIIYSERQFKNGSLEMSMYTRCVKTEQFEDEPDPVPPMAYVPPPPPPPVYLPPQITYQAPPMMTFRVPLDVSAGHMNVRNGPGSNHGLVGSIPAGQTVRASRCVPRDDGIAGADWCLVNWNGVTGWVSQAGLMPLG
jgi:Bacterial SH3 domain